ncbi:MAG: hypothetical protein EOT05_02680 [Candidatus Microsaccharimonas sossegonensis]|uniref:Uncharacterized protein n=1 Tax=Candidatus Microsaccharimonas sossegonensis TaxID=2506948 RepID=A0A4Q0AHP7_9BACT|nr:MAG: hypothetical protein EOT05_02680 [Candidatus Microsaccharimonas sossegonensis]
MVLDVYYRAGGVELGLMRKARDLLTPPRPVLSRFHKAHFGGLILFLNFFGYSKVMKRVRHPLTIIAIFVVIVTFFTSHTTYAAEPAQLINVSPSSTALSVEPGASAKGIVTVINQGTTSFQTKLTVSPYYVKNLQYTPSFTQLPGTIDPSTWVQFTSPITATVESKKLFDATYTVTVPAGTAPGGYYAVIFAETDVPNDAGSGVAARSRVGDILYITVNGNVTQAGTANAANLPLVITQDQVPLLVTVGNQGSVHFQTTINTNIKDMFNQTAFSYQANAYVLPQTARQLTTTWSPQAAVGIYRIEQTVSLPKGEEKLPIKWVVVVKPWVILVLIAIIILIILTLLFMVGRRIQKGKESHHI